MRVRRHILILALWLAATTLALCLDRAVAEWVRDQGLDAKRHWSDARSHATEVIKFPGEYYATLVVALVLGVFHPWRWRAAGFVALTGLVAGLNGTLKWTVGRLRPVRGIDPFQFHPFIEGLHGLFYARNLCFPSGHACLAFATATATGICLPRWRPLFYGIALVVAAERVLENAHYLSDVVIGAGLGVLAAHGTHWFLRRYAVPREPADVPPLADAVPQGTVRDARAGAG